MPDQQPDYRSSAISGTSWHRCLHIECNNPHNGLQTIRFDEERRMLLEDGTTIGTPAGYVQEAFTDPTIMFPLLDPRSGKEIGQEMSYGTVYAVLWSLYITLAAKRDADAEEERQRKEEMNNDGTVTVG